MFLLAAVLGVAWARPAKLDQSTTTPPPAHLTPLLVKDLGDLRVQVSERQKGEYGLRVYQKGDDRHQLPSTVWSVPHNWHPPGLERSRIVHAEVISTGDVVVAFFSLENGLDLILLPKELFVQKKTESGIIVYPKLPSPWHPTVSTPSMRWEWTSATTEYSVVSPDPQK